VESFDNRGRAVAFVVLIDVDEALDVLHGGEVSVIFSYSRAFCEASVGLDGSAGFNGIGKGIRLV
jgi:hypothetical protein